MLQKLNERIQGVVAWVIVILIAITFTLFGIDYYLQTRHESDAQVEVNGESISKQAFDLNYRRTQQMQDSSQAHLSAGARLKQQVLDEMIVNSLSMQAAHLAGFDVSVAQADSAIVSIPQFQQDGHFSEDRYQQALSGALFTPASFQKEVRQGMLLNQQRFAFIGTAFALPREIQQFVKLYLQTRDYAYLSIPAAQFVKQDAVTEQEVQAYFQNNQQTFLTPEKVSLEYVHLSLRDIKTKIHVTDEQIERYYEENQNNYYTPAQWQVAHILFALPNDATDEDKQRVKARANKVYQALLNNPMQFEKQIERVSDDKISAKHGGILPWIVAGQSEFDKPLLTMTKPGQISSPIRSKHGYELFKLIAYKPATIRALQDVKADIKEQLIADLAQAAYAQALEQLSDLSYQTPDSLAPVADALKLSVQHSKPFPRQGGEQSISKNKRVINAAFSHDVLELGNNSEPIQLDNDSVVVLRVKQHFPAVAKSLAEVHPILVEKLALMKAEQQARDLGRALLDAGYDSPKAKQLMNTHQLRWETVYKATRDTDSVPAAVNSMAFDLPRVGSETGQTVTAGNYVLVRLKKINDGQLASIDKEQAASITQQIEASYGMMDYDLYVSYLLGKASIIRH